MATKVGAPSSIEPTRGFLNSVLLGTTTLMLTGCGGGGGGPALTISPAPVVPPSAPVTPTPPPPLTSTDTSVELLEAPQAGELTAFTVGDAIRIRYDAAAKQYQVLIAGHDWASLVDDTADNTTPNSRFLLAFAAGKPEESTFSIQMHHRSPAATSRYRYSNLAYWRLGSPNFMNDQLREGIVAFGSATPKGQVPVVGTATYDGFISGRSTLTAKSGWGDMPNAPLMGTVRLQFDFGNGSLAGQMKPSLSCDCDPVEFPTFNFRETVFGVGSTTFSGRFDTNVSGENAFSGLFTGPNAEELIGQWTVPFVHGGATHSASGGWVAKQGQ